MMARDDYCYLRLASPPRLLSRRAVVTTSPVTPVWFMRQAGRSLPEYRALRTGVPMMETCRRPDLVCEITLQPVRRHGVDAAILFSDIVVPLAAAGIGVDIVAGVGPVVAEPIRTMSDVDAMRELTAADVSFVDEAVRLTVAELGATPLIGFAGAPFTLASYLVEGGPSRNHVKTKALMYGAPDVWHALCARLAQITKTFLQVQIDAGVSADPAVRLVGRRAVRGRLPPKFVMPHSTAVLGGLAGAGAIPYRGSTSASTPPRCCPRWARPARTWSAWIGVRRWTAPPRSSATGRCRATSIRPCCSRRPT